MWQLWVRRVLLPELRCHRVKRVCCSIPATGWSVAASNSPLPRQSGVTRGDVSDNEKSLWLWGARLGLPVLFAYLGVVVVLLRRLR